MYLPHFSLFRYFLPIFRPNSPKLNPHQAVIHLSRCITPVAHFPPSKRPFFNLKMAKKRHFGVLFLAGKKFWPKLAQECKLGDNILNILSPGINNPSPIQITPNNPFLNKSQICGFSFFPFFCFSYPFFSLFSVYFGPNWGGNPLIWVNHHPRPFFSLKRSHSCPKTPKNITLGCLFAG